MREHTAREKALFDVRMAVVRRWSERTEGSEETRMLFGRAHIDTKARLALRRQDLFYRAVLVEPTGEVPHHILDDTVWGYFRDEMRISPALFYAKASDQWQGLIGTTSPTDWRRAVYNAETEEIEPSLVSDTDVPGDYDNMPAETVMAFLNAHGGKVVPLDEIPDPYPPLAFADFTINVPSRDGRITTDLEPVGGKPPLAYALTEDPSGVPLILAQDRLIVIANTAQPGTHTAKVRVTDALGATAEATATIIVAEVPGR